MRVLIAAGSVAERTGAELFVTEIAVGLTDRGHSVVVYSPKLGRLVEGLRALGVSVTDKLSQVATPPDVIHGQGPLAVAAALDCFPGVPMLLVCHDHRELWPRRVINAPSVRSLAGVSRVCLQELLDRGAERSRTRLMPNYVDTERFAQRPPLPSRAVRALVFSNYAVCGGFVTQVQAACDTRGLQLDIVGAGMGSQHMDPAALLVSYDVVFAKGRAALEAAAVGCAVVLCDFAGLGPMVTPEAFDELRAMNFGFEALTEPHSAAAVGAQLARYDPDASAGVCERLRAEAPLGRYLTDLEHLLASLGADGCSVTPRRPLPVRLLTEGHLLAIRRFRALPPAPKERFRQVARPIARRILPSWRRMTLP